MNTVMKLKPKNQVIPKDGDGDDGNVLTDSITIKPVLNGWIVTTTFENDEEVTEVFDVDGIDDGNLQTVKCILDSMGLTQYIKIK